VKPGGRREPLALKDKFNLKDKLKECAVFARDAALNVGDAVTSSVRAYNDRQQGYHEDATREINDLWNKFDARRTARHANKP
jgi:hypothetical protein